MRHPILWRFERGSIERYEHDAHLFMTLAQVGNEMSMLWRVRQATLIQLFSPWSSMTSSIYG